MPAKKRVLVLDTDAAGQGEVQQMLVDSGLVAIGGPCLEDEGVAVALSLRPDLILVNPASDGALEVAQRIAEQLPNPVFLAYRRGRDGAAADGGKVVLGGRAVTLVDAGRGTLVPAIADALEGRLEPADPVPAVVDSADSGISDGVDERADDAVDDAVHAERLSVDIAAGERQVSLVSRFAQLANDWLEGDTPVARERFECLLREDIVSEFFATRGRKAMLRALKDLSAMMDGRIRFVPGEAAGKPTLAAMVRTDGAEWARAGHFIAGFDGAGRVASVDYHEEDAASR